MKQANIRIVVSGSTWMGDGLGSVESALYDLFKGARNEVTIVAYSITASKILDPIFEQIEGLLKRSILVRIIVNRFSELYGSAQGRLRNLEQRYRPFLELFSFDPDKEKADLHAKIIMVDRQKALVGSANLSLRGLLDNHELGVIVEGSIVADIGKAIDKLFASPHTRAIT